jgi:hypothetical protein
MDGWQWVTLDDVPHYLILDNHDFRYQYIQTYSLQRLFVYTCLVYWSTIPGSQRDT